jgi:methylated-DNA-[protein]-cysteine S-methyltransferase
MTTYYTYINSTLGKALLLSDGKSLTGFYLDKQKYFPKIEKTWERDDDLKLFQQTEKQITQYLAGKKQAFDLPCTFVQGTEFQQKVWKAIAKIPFGKTQSYREIAENIKSPKSVRAVGTATGRNPISIVIPCHRVIGSDGSLTGYAGGLTRKKSLLKLEGL